jgi:hypothetical protein
MMHVLSQTESMTTYGYLIIHALVTDIEPAPKVREAMNGKCGPPEPGTWFLMLPCMLSLPDAASW